MRFGANRQAKSASKHVILQAYGGVGSTPMLNTPVFARCGRG